MLWLDTMPLGCTCFTSMKSSQQVLAPIAPSLLIRWSLWLIKDPRLPFQVVPGSPGLGQASLPTRRVWVPSRQLALERRGRAWTSHASASHTHLVTCPLSLGGVGMLCSRASRNGEGMSYNKQVLSNEQMGGLRRVLGPILTAPRALCLLPLETMVWLRVRS